MNLIPSCSDSGKNPLFLNAFYFLILKKQFLAALHCMWNFSSPAGDLTHAQPAVEAWSPNRWTARESPRPPSLEVWRAHGLLSQGGGL